MRRFPLFIIIACLMGCHHRYSIFPANYRYSNNAKDIPQRISDSLKKWYSGNFILADTFNKLHCDFTDIVTGESQTDKRLTFLLLNGNKCILVYQEGPRMQDYTVIYLLQYSGSFYSRRIESQKGVFDTLGLKNLLSKTQFKLKFFEMD